jgi:hypothetical protein
VDIYSAQEFTRPSMATELEHSWEQQLRYEEREKYDEACRVEPLLLTYYIAYKYGFFQRMFRTFFRIFYIPQLDNTTQTQRS